MIRLENVTVRAGQFALRDVSLEIPAGGYGALMGRTGSGKTTLLEAVAGLKAVAAGRIFVEGRDVTRAAPAARGIGYVPQDGALFARMSVADHLGFALRIRGVPRRVIRERTAELAGLLGIEHLLDRTPRGLSGGERRRVALGRALSFRPGALLLDEPLVALDGETRDAMVELLRRVQRVSGATVLHVTHDLGEAASLAGTFLQIRDGTVRSVDIEQLRRRAGVSRPGGEAPCCPPAGPG